VKNVSVWTSVKKTCTTKTLLIWLEDES